VAYPKHEFYDSTELLCRGNIVALKSRIVSEDWFDAVGLRSLKEKMTTVMEKTENALKE
jgi:hypothetical protein